MRELTYDASDVDQDYKGLEHVSNDPGMAR